MYEVQQQYAEESLRFRSPKGSFIEFYSNTVKYRSKHAYCCTYTVHTPFGLSPSSGGSRDFVFRFFVFSKTTGAEEPPAEITVTVKQKGKPELSLKAPSGANLRNLLTDNGINVYQSITRWTNCKGKQLCG